MLSYIWSYFKTPDATTNATEINADSKEPVVNEPCKMSKKDLKKMNRKKALNYLQAVTDGNQ